MTLASLVPTHRALRNVGIRAVSAAGLAAVLVSSARVTAQTPRNDELNRRLTQLEATTSTLKAAVEASQVAQLQKELAAVVASVDSLKRTVASQPPRYEWVAWIVFGVVGVAFAIAYAWVSWIREETRLQEFDAQKAERLVEASTAQTKALAGMVRILNPKAQDPKTTAELVATLLQQTADYIKKNG